MIRLKPDNSDVHAETKHGCWDSDGKKWNI